MNHTKATKKEKNDGNNIEKEKKFNSEISNNTVHYADVKTRFSPVQKMLSVKCKKKHERKEEKMNFTR